MNPMLDTIISAWANLEADGASCILDLSPDTAGGLVPLFHCTNQLAETVTWWLANPFTLIRLISWVIA